MKFQKIEGFEKHFKQAYPSHLCAVYIILSSNEAERKKILSSLSGILEKEADFRRCEEITAAINHLNGGSLFSTRVVASMDGAHQLLKADQKLLVEYIQSPNPLGTLLLGAESCSYMTELYKKGKREVVVLDLSKEKPWEEKERLQKWIVQTLKFQKKEIRPEAVELLLKMVGADRLMLQQELDKCICYALDRSVITKEDIAILCANEGGLNSFRFAQELVWETPSSIPQLSDLSSILPLVGLLRSQLEMGLKMGGLVKKGIGREEIAEQFPRLWPKALEQCLNGVRQKGLHFFKTGLMDLFELELGLKTSRAKPATLFAIFCAQMINTSAVK